MHKPSVDKRTLELQASQSKLAKIKTMSATIFHVLQTSPEQALKVRKALKNLHKVVKSSSLLRGEGIYADYLFGGDTIDYKALDQQVQSLQDGELKKPINDRKKYSHAVALTDMQLMQKFLEHGVNFDAHPAAQKRIRTFVDVLCPGGIQCVDDRSKQNIILGEALANTTGKKLVVLCNHVSHMDALVLDAFFSQLKQDGVLPKYKKHRFVEGVYMALTPGIRQFSIGFDTTKVIGESDMQMLLSHAKKNNTPQDISYEYDDECKHITTTPLQQLKQLKQQVKEAFFAHPDTEISMIFQYAGRGEYGGVKQSINPFMHDFLTSSSCVYISLNMHDTNQLRPTKSDFFLGAHTWFQPFDIKVHVSEPRIGGTKNIDEIHALSLYQRDCMWPEFAQIEKRKKHDMYIVDLQHKISAILAMIDAGEGLSDSEIADYNTLVSMYLAAVEKI